MLLSVCVSEHMVVVRMKAKDVGGSSVPSGTGSAHPISTKVRAVV